MSIIYPFALEPTIVPAIWGGSALVDRYGKTGDAAAQLGESWECWSENTIKNGSQAGKTVGELCRSFGAGLVGLTKVYARDQYPILSKIIDAREALSVQVHPNDADAKRLENQPNGKTECWHILEAKPDSELILGFSRDTDADEYRRRVADGTLGEILRRVPVKAGETYYIPAGTLHSIGAGIVLFETQQTSTVTYRIFDWNRKDASGKPRELHVDKAAEVLNFRASTFGAIQSVAYRITGFQRDALVAEPRFGLELSHFRSRAFSLTDGASYTITTMKKAVRLTGGTEQVDLPPWSTALIPASLARLDVEAGGGEETSLILAFPPGADERLKNRFEAIRRPLSDLEPFLEQFNATPSPV